MKAILPILLRASVLACALGGGAAALAQTPAAQVQSTTVQGVTVKVVPQSLGAGGTWSFQLTFDTHSQSLDDDLLQSTVLVTDDGRELKPTAWKGAGPGGHHREGVLEFSVPEPAARSVELRMQRPGERALRSFRWPAG